MGKYERKDFQEKTPVKSSDLGELSVIGDPRLLQSFFGFFNRFGAFHSYNPDSLVGRKGLGIYDKMLHDDQVIAVQTIKKNAVLQPGWDIVPASEDEIDEEIAEFVKYNFEEMKGNLEDKLSQIMTSMDYGFSVSELVYSIIDKGEYKDKVGLKDIKTRSPHSFYFKIDEHGNLDALIQHNYGYNIGPGNKGYTEYSPDKFIVDINNKKFDNWYGESDLRNCYRSWWSKDNLIKWWNIFGERHSIPLALGRYSLDNVTTSPEHQEELKKIINAIQTRMSVLLPPGSNIEFQEVNTGGERFFVASVNFHDSAIAKALLMPQLLGVASQQKQGSFAQAKKQFDVFILVLSRLRKKIEETIMLEQVIKRLVDFNYVVDKYPKFKFLELTNEDRFEIAKIWIEAVKGSLVLPDLKDENKLRKILGFDKRDTETIFPTPVIEVPEEEFPEKGESEEKEEPTKEEELSITFFRKPDEIESKVDFNRIKKNLDKIEDKFKIPLVELYTKQKQKLLDLIKRKVDKGILDQRFIREINLKHRQEIQRVLRDFMAFGFEMGREDLNREAGGIKFAINPVLPKDALKFLEDKSFWITGVVNDDVLNDVKGLLIEGLKTGLSFAEIAEGIDEIFKPFIGDPGTITKTGVTTPWRIETIIRTNLSEAYNEGRKAMAASPELQDFIVGWEYSEILDSRTTEISKFIDNKKIKKNDPDLPRLSYPLHFNDRGVFVPVTIDDLPVTWITPGQKIRLKRDTKKFKTK